MHKSGVLATVEVTTGKGLDGELLHQSTDWAEPAQDWLMPARVLEAGQGFQLRCQYENQSDRVITFGESANDEMCFIAAMYYPSTRGFVLGLD